MIAVIDDYDDFSFEEEEEIGNIEAEPGMVEDDDLAS